MKNLTLFLVFVFFAFFANAQLSAENYCFDDSQEFQFAGAWSLSDVPGDQLSDLDGNDFTKKRRRRKKRRGRRGGPENVVKINLTNLVFMSPTITYERKLSDEMSAGGSLIYTSYNYSLLDIKLSGPKVFLDFKYYTGGEAPARFYVGGFLFFSTYELIEESTLYIDMETGETYNSLEATFTSYGVGGMAGFQIVTDLGLVFDIYTGIGAGGNNIKVNVGSDDSFADLGMLAGVTGRGGVSIGWAF